MKLRHAALTALALVTFGAPAALAAPAGPSDADLLGARTVGVLPILATGPSADAAWTRVGVAVASGERGADARAPGAVAVELGDAGFAFAGEATSADVQALRYGYYLGMMPALIESEHAGRADVAARLLESLHVLEGLDAAVVDGVKAALASVEAVDGAAFAEIMAGAQRGIAEGDARRHGYLAAGMWVGLTTLALWQGRADDTLLGMVHPMTALLEEDAAFGSADHQVARVMRRLAVELAMARPDADRVFAMAAEVLEIDVDAATAPRAE